MSKEQLVMRLLSMLSGVDTDRLRFKGTTAAERERLAKAQEALEQLPLILEYCGSDGYKGQLGFLCFFLE